MIALPAFRPRHPVEFGWTNPILVDADGGLLAGHGRLLAELIVGDDVGTSLGRRQVTENHYWDRIKAQLMDAAI
jgi:ParB-like chromosome segregation protein Spo0J